jgi:hypothetical protein
MIESTIVRQRPPDALTSNDKKTLEAHGFGPNQDTPTNDSGAGKRWIKFVAQAQREFSLLRSGSPLFSDSD